MNQVQNFIKQIKYSYAHFINRGYSDVYGKIFGMDQYPFFFIANSIWVAYVVHKSGLRCQKNILLRLKQFFVSFLITFAPRELLALMLHKFSPIQRNPQSVVIFLIVNLLMMFSPFDLIYKITNILYYFLGFIVGANQARFFNLLLRNLKGIPPYYIMKKYNISHPLFISLSFSVMDQLLETLLRSIFKWEETSACNTSSILRTNFFMGTFWAATNRCFLTQYLGYHDQKLASVFLVFALGMTNSLNAFSDLRKYMINDQQTQQQQTQQQQTQQQQTQQQQTQQQQQQEQTNDDYMKKYSNRKEPKIVDFTEIGTQTNPEDIVGHE